MLEEVKGNLKISQMITDGNGKNELSGRERFLKAAKCLPVDYPPVWMMRQAGRALPEYRKLREKYSFLELVKTPELAAEVTLQPIRRFNFDAAIIFSDILVVPEAMGQRYFYSDKNGIKMEYAISSREDIVKLNTNDAAERLEYVYKAISIVKKSLKSALIGFSGSPWTLANFMIEGGSTKNFVKARKLFLEHREDFELLMEKLVSVISKYLLYQIDYGTDTIQIFDTLGGLLSPSEFKDGSARWIGKIVKEINGKVPVIIFSKGVYRNWDDLINTGANVIGIDNGFQLSEARKILSESVAIQGNLDPELLRMETSEYAVKQTEKILSDMNGRNGFIFNLGHGVPPDARLQNIEAVLKVIRKV
ncbi:MAG TPA: uroporphyrinogen decarboxylase [Verrucomicrobiota bacterium]|nr:uroporphyrinogen decarboxylase [Verrucomicrobiota bacterium]